MSITMLVITRIEDTAMQKYLLDTKLNLVFAKKLSMGSFLRTFSSINARNMVFVTNKAVNKLEIRPIDKVTANPLIGPEPNWKSIKAAMSVVTLESMIALRALLKPILTAAWSGRPLWIS